MKSARGIIDSVLGMESVSFILATPKRYQLCDVPSDQGVWGAFRESKIRGKSGI
jgi:hypothetical protein